MLAEIIRRLRADPRTPIRGKGYSGAGELLKKGANQLRAYIEQGCSHFVVCYDADGPDPSLHQAEVQTRIVGPARVEDRCCIVIPVQEIEAWILADVEAASKIFTSWRPKPVENPENIPSPKEYLEKLCRADKNSRRYSHAMDNQRLAHHIDLNKVSKKCKSFRSLEAFARSR
jgi:hypothetical protein